jgi:hypothetical protein
MSEDQKICMWIGLYFVPALLVWIGLALVRLSRCVTELNRRGAGIHYDNVSAIWHNVPEVSPGISPDAPPVVMLLWPMVLVVVVGYGLWMGVITSVIKVVALTQRGQA